MDGLLRQHAPARHDGRVGDPDFALPEADDLGAVLGRAEQCLLSPVQAVVVEELHLVEQVGEVRVLPRIAVALHLPLGLLVDPAIRQDAIGDLLAQRAHVVGDVEHEEGQHFGLVAVAGLPERVEVELHLFLEGAHVGVDVRDDHDG